MKKTLTLISILAASPIVAENDRQLEAHEHGVGALNIAIDGTTVAMEFHAPGADIVGFEHAAESEADRDSVDAAVAILAAPKDLFVLPASAECTVTQASAELESEDSHDADEHAEHEDHEEDHAEHEDHEEDHEDEAGHTEFHAEYRLTCANPEALTDISFAYFETFANARELHVQIITNSGAQAFDVERNAPVLDLKNLF